MKDFIKPLYFLLVCISCLIFLIVTIKICMKCGVIRKNTPIVKVDTVRSTVDTFFNMNGDMITIKRKNSK